MCFLVCSAPLHGAVFVKFRYLWCAPGQLSVGQMVARGAVLACQTGRFGLSNVPFRSAERPVSLCRTVARGFRCGMCQDVLPSRASVRQCLGLSPWRLQNYAIPLKWQNVAACILCHFRTRAVLQALSLHIIYILAPRLLGAAKCVASLSQHG